MKNPRSIEPTATGAASIRGENCAEPAAEAMLERVLKEIGGGALAGSYRREAVIGDWRVDFYFPSVMLAIEVDGGYHRAPRRRRLDLMKSRDLAVRGITLVRLANAEVLGDRERLVDRLREAWRLAARNLAHRSRRVEETRAAYGRERTVATARRSRPCERCRPATRCARNSSRGAHRQQVRR